MKKLIAFCGLSCSTCQIYLATREKVETVRIEMRSSIAVQCNKLYKTNFTAGDINDCDGCGNFAGRLFRGCINCEIRNCVLLKRINSCAFCDSFPCEKLEKHFTTDPLSKERLIEMRSNQPE